MKILGSTLVAGALSVSALPAYESIVDQAKKAKVMYVVSSVRSALEMQKMQIMLKCGGDYDTKIYPDQINNNDMTAGKKAPCSQKELPGKNDKRILTDYIPENPFANSAEVVDCSEFVHNPCEAAEYEGVGGWCYAPKENKIWASSNVLGECRI